MKKCRLIISGYYLSTCIFHSNNSNWGHSTSLLHTSGSVCNLYLFFVFVFVFCSSCVRVVSSDRSGMGKSLYIKFLAEKLAEKQPNSGVVHVTIPLHGPVVSPDTVLELFKDHLEKPPCCIYHIDIAPSVCLGISFVWATCSIF